MSRVTGCDIEASQSVSLSPVSAETADPQHVDGGWQQRTHGGDDQGTERCQFIEIIKSYIADLISPSQANTEKPEWSEEERVVRDDVLTNVGDAGGYEDAGLKKQIMVDRSAPVVGGQYRT